MNLLEYCKSQKRATMVIERLKKQDMIYAGASERRLLLKRVFDESGASSRYILRLLNESGLCPEHFGLESFTHCSREREKSNICKICFRRLLIKHHIINEEESDI